MDQNGISANLQHGVPTLTLPKVAQAKARRISVQVNRTIRAAPATCVAEAALSFGPGFW